MRITSRWFVSGLLLVLVVAPAAAGDLPNKALTPGAVMPIGKRAVCTGNTEARRNVSAATKALVYRAYGMSPRKPPCACEVDHLVPLEVGGSNDRRNLWPQSYRTQPWNAHVKDHLENWLHQLVCHNQMALATAQACIKRNWIACYRKVRAP